MTTKTKIALAAALFAATSSVALAQGFDPNMANRYPAYANSNASQTVVPRGALQSAPVRLRDGLPGTYTGQPSEIDLDRADRASSPYAGGGF